MAHAFNIAGFSTLDRLFIRECSHGSFIDGSKFLRLRSQNVKFEDRQGSDSDATPSALELGARLLFSGSNCRP